MTAMIDRPAPGPARLIKLVGTALAGATLLTVFVVLPAEYRLDLTGFGAWSGLNRLSAPREVVVEARPAAPPEISRSSAVPFRSDTVRVRVGSLTENFGEIEYKITMAAGDTVVYSWTAAQDLFYEFHGHTLETEDTPQIEVMNYRSDTAASSHGTLVAAMDGIHGWYFRNNAVDTAVEVELKLSGFYKLEPGVMTIQ